MGDIKGGSETPKLVGKVLGWKKEFVEESTLLYKDLNNANIALIESLEELHDLHKNDAESYQTQIEKLSAISISTNNASLCIGPFEKLIQSIKDIRLNLRRLTKFSGAEIEPIEQTELLDSCNLIPGVIGGVVPGAGGYDAICLLVVEKAIKNVLDSTSEKLSSVTWLDLNEEADGVLEENPSKYEGLIN